MSVIEFEKMKSSTSFGDFNCGNPTINGLITQSVYPTILQHASAYKFSVDSYVLGYYMLKFRNIKLDICPEEISEFNSSICKDCFSVHINYLAVDLRYQRKGIGTQIIDSIKRSVFSLCEEWPIRLITIDAIKGKYKWYIQNGFKPFDENDLKDENPTIHMYYDCFINQEELNEYLRMG